MPTAQIQSKFANLENKFKTQYENIAIILSVMEDGPFKVFNLEVLNNLLAGNEGEDWATNAAKPSIKLFENALQAIGSEIYSPDEVRQKLFPFLHDEFNKAENCKIDHQFPALGNAQPGLWEKFQLHKLGNDLNSNAVLNNYSMTPLDMLRSAQKCTGTFSTEPVPVVLELAHFKYFSEEKKSKLKEQASGRPFFIRSTKCDKLGLSQWILVYRKKEDKKTYIYSESAISEDDKTLLNELLDGKEYISEGMSYGLSMLSGMSAVAHLVQEIGGAGMTSSADYFSLLIEWVWLTSSKGISSHPDKAGSNWTWIYFKQGTLKRKEDDTYEFLNFDQARAWYNVNETYVIPDAEPDASAEVKADIAAQQRAARSMQIQMRSYFLGLGVALEKINILTVNKITSEVTLNCHQENATNNAVSKSYDDNKCGDRACYVYNSDLLAGNPANEDYFRRSLVLNAFRGYAKEKTLIINLPAGVKLEPYEINLICALMQMNPFVCELKNPLNNPSLTDINDRLAHIFARNRWLRENGYVPPLLAGFWEIAAEYTVAYLKTCPNLFSEDREAVEFKRCMREMGTHGLKPVLDYLEARKADLEPVFNPLLLKTDGAPVFYAGASRQDFEQLTKLLTDHLGAGKYFPFKQFQLSFVVGKDSQILDLLNQLNATKQFDKISLTDCLSQPDGVTGLVAFLRAALARANAEGSEWTCPIHIPELDKPQNVAGIEEAQRLYGELNNLLVRRARQKNATPLIDNSLFKQAHDVAAAAPVEAHGAAAAQAHVNHETAGLVAQFAAKTAQDEQPRSFHRSGGLALQMQQQQQMKQERSRCLDNETEQGQAFADVLPSKLIDFNNIDIELAVFYEELNAEHPVDATKATLKADGGHVLKSFFRTWVNANPAVNAPEIIRKMTPLAAMTLLKHHKQLSGGLNVNNLPQGFYTQRLASGELVLAYKPTLGYTTSHNKLTLKLNNTKPTLTRILGDYRQFNDFGLSNSAFNRIMFLAQMQPKLTEEERRQRYKQFKQNGYNDLSVNHKNIYNERHEIITNNWESFYACSNAGQLDAFWSIINLRTDNHGQFGYSRQDIIRILPLTALAKQILVRDSFRNIDLARTLGQIYNYYGTPGLTRFSNLIVTIEQRLGQGFVDSLAQNYLRFFETFNPLLDPSSLDTFDKLIAELEKAESAGEKELFLTFIQLQTRAAGVEDITTLWKGFQYFYARLKDFGVENDLTPALLAGARPQGQNLFPCFERIITSLEHIHSPELRQQFIRSLATIDLTEGGVPYAVRHDGLTLVAPELHLADFQDGSPTYKPLFAKLYTDEWTRLHTLRAIASKPFITPENYNFLKGQPLIPSQLIMLLHTQWTNPQDFLASLAAKDQDSVEIIARHFHKAFYTQQQSDRRYAQAVLDKLSANSAQLNKVLEKHPNSLTFFDCCQMLNSDAQLNDERLTKLFDLFLSDELPENHPHLEQGLKLAAIFNLSIKELKQFFDTTKNLYQITRNELPTLTQQLLSVNSASLPANEDGLKGIWSSIIAGVEQINSNPLETAEYRIRLMRGLTGEPHNLKFKSSISGDYRLVLDQDLTALSLERIFPEHSERLSHFFKKHIAIAESETANAPLKPLIEFFKRMQANKTYFNEIEPLLSTLEKILQDHQGKCWSADYLNGLLRVLQPEDAGFSMGIFQALLTEHTSCFQPKNLDELTPKFDEENKWTAALQAIQARAKTFDRAQQALIARLAVHNSQNLEFISIRLIPALAAIESSGVREAIVARLIKAPANEHERLLAQSIDLSRILNDKPEVCCLWLEALTKNPEFEAKLKAVLDLETSKQQAIFEVMAYSCFKSDTYPTLATENFVAAPCEKPAKLLDILSKYTGDDLQSLAQIYPNKPGLDARELLKTLKQQDGDVKNKVEQALRENQLKMRSDYQTTYITRTQDLRRMMESTYVTRGADHRAISGEAGTKLMMMFKYLKDLETGKNVINLEGFDRPIYTLSRENLQGLYQALSAELKVDPQNVILQTQMWAVLFETLGRTTYKYPHLAQQFALMANDVLVVDSKSSILKLKTGEGKSHFVALRAALHAGLGKRVSVCTAKWSLASRDLQDYQAFFDYLGLTAKNVHSRSTAVDFTGSNIVYTTPGDLSLFLDEQAIQGEAIEVDKATNVALGDEFDFLYYEGQNTQYNYARHTGITPKEMAWFYRGLNDFYDVVQTENPEQMPQIDKALLERCYQYLCEKSPESGRGYLLNLRPPVLASWMQSSFEAATLEFGVNYTVQESQVKVGEEVFDLKEICPLTKDMQAAIGSTFSNGTHQLLAERLNSQAKLEGKAQNYHVHPESMIVSSQIFSERLEELFGHSEGFTGTVSSTQAVELHAAHTTAVLNVPTNQKDLRDWKDAEFFNDDEARIRKMAKDIKERLDQKKSILLSCATDADVSALVIELKKSFTEEQWNSQVLSHTNESTKTAAEVLVEKTRMEGSKLGQKERGVLLIAAGFGRGDNVGVETVMLNKVYDINDLGQKGGRTARNGAAGEVLQYYLNSDVDQQLKNIKEFLDKGEMAGSKHKILAALNVGGHALATFFDGTKNLNAIDCKKEQKFKLILSIQEFLQAKQNYASLAYHKTKAKLSTAAVKIFASTGIESKEAVMNTFKTFLERLEQAWNAIQAQDGSDENKIDQLNAYIVRQKGVNGLLHGEDFARFEFTPPALHPVEFVLDVTPPKRENVLLTQAEQILLKLESVPDSSEQWDEVIALLNGLSPLQLTTLISFYNTETPIRFNQFITTLKNLTGAKKVDNDVKAMSVPTTISKGFTDKPYHQDLTLIPAEASDAVREYLLTPVTKDLTFHQHQADSLVVYSRNNSHAASYWLNPAVRDELILLPQGCLSSGIKVDAAILLSIKKFLDMYRPVKNAEQAGEYANVFHNCLVVISSEPDQRIRLFNKFQIILNASGQDKSEMVNKLVKIMYLLKEPQHGFIVDKLITKIADAYSRNRDFDFGKLDNLIDILVSKDSLEDFLPSILTFLNTRGKEFLPLITSACDSITDSDEDSQRFLQKVWDNLSHPISGAVKRKKQERLKAFESISFNMYLFLKDLGKDKTAKLFSMFELLLGSHQFINYDNYEIIFQGLRNLIENGIVVEDIKDLTIEHQLGLAFIAQDKDLASNYKTLIKIKPILDYFSKESCCDINLLPGVKALVASFKENLQSELNEVLSRKQDSELKNLLITCGRYPQFAHRFVSLPRLVRFLNSDFFEKLSDDVKLAYSAQMNVFFEKYEKQQDKLIKQCFSMISDAKIHWFFYLFSKANDVIGIDKINHLKPILTYLSSDDFNRQHVSLCEQKLNGITVLLGKIKDNQLSIEILGAILKNKKSDDIRTVLVCCNKFSEHAHRLIAIPRLVDFLENGLYQRLDESQKEIFIKGMKNFFTKVESNHDQIQNDINDLSDDELYDLFNLFAEFPHGVTINSIKDFMPLVNYMGSNDYQNQTEPTKADQLKVIGLILSQNRGLYVGEYGLAQFDTPELMQAYLNILFKSSHMLDAESTEIIRYLNTLKPLIELSKENSDLDTGIIYLLQGLVSSTLSIKTIAGKLSTLDRNGLLKLLSSARLTPEGAAGLLFSGTLELDLQNDRDLLIVIQGFYNNFSNPKVWLENELMTMTSIQRIKLLTVIKNGSLIIDDFEDQITDLRFSEHNNNELFDAVMDIYANYVEKVLAEQSAGKGRGLSSSQQQKICAVMHEIKEIGADNSDHKNKDLNDKRKEEITKFQSLYKKILFKDDVRASEVNNKINDLVATYADKNYQDTLVQLRKIKKDLMVSDAEKASKQWFPRLHFWGQSRLYRMLNDMEDKLIQAWTQDALDYKVDSKTFEDTMKETLDEHVDALKNALAQWERSQPLVFSLGLRKTSRKMAQDIQCLDSAAEVVEYLSNHADDVKQLPGYLHAIAQEVVNHSGVNVKSAPRMFT